MSTWYETTGHNYTGKFSGPKITPVEILRSSTSSIWNGDRRRAKRSDYTNYFETEAEAKSFIADCQRLKIEYYQARLDEHTETLDAFL